MANSDILVLFVAFCALTIIKAEIPDCTYLDTVELTDGDKLQNGSYVYEGVLIPPELIGEYDYELISEGQIKNVPKHRRGCVCKLKPCIRLCCHPKATLDLQSGECVGDVPEFLKFNPYVDITYDNGTTHQMHVLNEFVSQRGLPCSSMFMLSAETDELNEWKLFENGTLFRSIDEAYLTKQEYCLQPALHEVTNEHVFKPHNCAIVNEHSLFEYIIVYIMIVSVIFFILTILVYLFIPKLQNLNGKCLICYLTSLALSFTMLNASFHFYNLPPLPCNIVGYAGYFFTISAFAWTSVISFDLWNTFRGLRYDSIRPNTIFRLYSLLAWGIGALLTIAIYLIDITNRDSNWISGIGIYTCWVTTSMTMPQIYLYGPMFIMLIFNTTMFILSARKIAEIKKRLEQSDVREAHAKHLSTNRQMYSIFLRLFFIMGIVWILELLSTTDIENKFLGMIQKFGDLLSASQGVIIFVLLVLRPKVRRLVVERIRCRNNSQDEDESSNEGISLQEKTCAVSTLN